MRTSNVNCNYLFMFPAIRVNKSADINDPGFRTIMTAGLQNAYLSAFSKAYSVFINQKSRTLVEPSLIKVNLVDILKTGVINPENTKQEVNLRYIVLNNNRVLNSSFAADSINMLSIQEMAQALNSDMLNTEIIERGFVEVMPYNKSPPAQPQYWIIGAVLGPIVFIVIVFWLIAYIYYRCINPKRNFKKQGSRLKDESAGDVSSCSFTCS